MRRVQNLPDELRSWACGDLPLEAATEMLIRGGMARSLSPWVHIEPDGRSWIDFEAIPDCVGGMSGGEKRFLRIAVSIAGECEVTLGDELVGIDRRQMQLVLAAVAHAAGMHQAGRYIEVDEDHAPRIVNVAPLYTWPGTVVHEPVAEVSGELTKKSRT